MAGVHAFDSDEKLSVLLEFVLVSENNLGKRGATAGVVHNVLHDSLDVSADKEALHVRHSIFDCRVIKMASVTLLLTLCVPRSPRF